MCVIHEFWYDCGHFQKKEDIVCEDLHCANKQNKTLELEVYRSESWIKCKNCLVDAYIKQRMNEVVEFEIEALSEAISNITSKAKTEMHKVLTEFGLGGKDFERAKLCLHHVLRHIPDPADAATRDAAKLLKLDTHKKYTGDLSKVFAIISKAVDLLSDEMDDVLEELGLTGPECAPFKNALDQVISHIRERAKIITTEFAERIGAKIKACSSNIEGKS